MKKMLISVLLSFAVGAALGYIIKGSKTIIQEKEKIVHVKADRVEQKSDGSIVATGNVTFGDKEKEYTKKEINKKRLAVNLGVAFDVSAVSKLNYWASISYSCIGPFGIGALIMTDMSSRTYVGPAISVNF